MTVMARHIQTHYKQVYANSKIIVKELFWRHKKTDSINIYIHTYYKQYSTDYWNLKHGIQSTHPPRTSEDEYTYCRIENFYNGSSRMYI